MLKDMICKNIYDDIRFFFHDNKEIIVIVMDCVGYFRVSVYAYWVRVTLKTLTWKWRKILLLFCFLLNMEIFHLCRLSWMCMCVNMYIMSKS